MKKTMALLLVAIFGLFFAACGGGGGDTGGSGNPADTTPPVIAVLGSNPATVDVGAVYTDAGATAADDVDGNISHRITTTGLPVNTSAPGSFTVTYAVSDAAGNPASVTRTVNVVAVPVP